MQIIDTHAHIYLKEFNNDIDLVIQRAKSIGIEKILMPSLCSDSFFEMSALKKKFPEYIYNMIGVHPLYVNNDFFYEIKKIEKLLYNEEFIAIGEIGLDFYNANEDFYEMQIAAFLAQLEFAQSFKLPLVIHCRNSFEKLIGILQNLQGEKLKGVFHCFSGELDHAMKIIDLGFYLGIGGTVTFGNSNLKNILKNIPLSSIVLETDCPYLSPIPYRGKRNEPSYLKEIITFLANLYDMDVNEFSYQTTLNTNNLFFYKNSTSFLHN